MTLEIVARRARIVRHMVLNQDAIENENHLQFLLIGNRVLQTHMFQRAVRKPLQLSSEKSRVVGPTALEKPAPSLLTRSLRVLELFLDLKYFQHHSFSCIILHIYQLRFLVLQLRAKSLRYLRIAQLGRGQLALV